MKKIELLDDVTINKIAAGEVIERPLSIVKELVENSIDAGAGAITVEIKGGGIDFIRVTDNGSGIEKDQVRTAFLPHATSKIRSADDLFDVRSLGFRGEALSTIAAVSQVEIVTKIRGELSGVRYKIDGGKEISFEEVGCGDGTTFIAKNLFFHVPARRKFLKSAMTETGYITDFIQKIAIERSDIAFKYIVGNDNKLVTTGNGSVKDNIYKIYGREIADAILDVVGADNGMSLKGYVARPIVARNNRSNETFFVNGHAVDDKVLEKAVETAFKPFLMQHKFPFAYLMLSLDPGMVDVNVHPRKSEVKYSLATKVYDFVERTVEEKLSGVELLNGVNLVEEKNEKYIPEKNVPEPFENRRYHLADKTTDAGYPAKIEAVDINYSKSNATITSVNEPSASFFKEVGEGITGVTKSTQSLENKGFDKNAAKSEESRIMETVSDKAKQMELFEDKIIQKDNKPEFRIVGCVFDTYWIIEYRNKMIMIDQHAAHEKVMYEKFVKEYRSKKVVAQYIDPPVIMTLSPRQENTIEENLDAFSSLGFEIERFQGNDYALRSVPSGFMKLESKEIFTGLIDELSEINTRTEDVSVIHDRLAQMSCKAAVKGGDKLSLMEADELLSQLLSLDNPYNCPHGRPTMVEFTEKDLEKYFKRIL